MVLRERSERREEGSGASESQRRLTSCHGWWMLGNGLEVSVWVAGVEVTLAGKGLEKRRICGEKEFPFRVAEALGRLPGDVEQWGEPRTWTLWLGRTRWKPRLQVSLLSNFSKIQFLHEYQRLSLTESAWELRVIHVRHWTPCQARGSWISSYCYGHLEVEPWS